MKWLRHAFAVDEGQSADPTPRQQPGVDWVCIQVAKRHLTTPGLIALEMVRPLNWIGAQAMHAARPGVWAIASQLTYEDYVQFSEFLEHRGSIEYLARRVEHFESEFTRLEKAGEPAGQFIKKHLAQVRAAASSETPQDTQQEA